MFLVAKTAPAATAALGFAGYLLNAMDMSTQFNRSDCFGCCCYIYLIVLGGIQRSNLANIAIVSITLCHSASS